MGNLYYLLILEALDLLFISIKGSILPPVCLHKREESVELVILRGWENKNIEDGLDLGSGSTMLPSASYWRPWSSKAWESSWPITTPIAPEDFHNNQSSPFFNQWNRWRLLVGWMWTFPFYESMNLTKVEAGRPCHAEEGSLQDSGRKGDLSQIGCEREDVVFWKPGCWEACSRRWWWTGSSPTLSGRPALRAFSGSLATPTGWEVQQ